MDFMASQHSVAIIGGGFSGLLLALQLVRKGPPDLTVVLIERTPGFGLGVAYATDNPEHLLNVRVGNMSPFPDQPRGLRDWLEQESGERVDDGAFASRASYGRYLRTLLAEAIGGPDGAARLRLAPDEAVDLAERDGKMIITLAMGLKIEARTAVLAVGAMGTAAPGPGLETLGPSLYAGDPWAPAALDDLPDDAPVLLLGSGLTMVDVALSLARRGHNGPVLALSRRGLAPRSHAGGWNAHHPAMAVPQLRLSQRLKWVRRRADEIGWRAAIDALRPHTQTFWAEASVAEQRRFLRHLRPWWDVHRHRMAPPVAARIEAMRESGRLTIAAGRLIGAAPVDDQAQVTWRARGEDRETRGRFGRVINCTGWGGNLRGAHASLIRALIERGEARVDCLGLGLDVDGHGRLQTRDGPPHPGLFALGPITRGAFWESVAVPDIRNQAAALADRLICAAET
jgi:uncharacterized NAD(P)/FAD-binding protein YdhS